jgi:hypothetical protein
MTASQRVNAKSPGKTSTSRAASKKLEAKKNKVYIESWNFNFMSFCSIFSLES